MKVIGRIAEQAELASAWAKAQAGEPQLVIIWGRRRVGKTYLLTHFASGKRSIYFTATRQDSEDRQLRRFAEALQEQLGDEVRDIAPPGFPDWEAAFRFVFRLAESKPLLIVLDEAPRLSAGRSDIADLLSAAWENRVRAHQLLLVLSGSAVSTMEEWIGPKGGLHRRASVERRMDPFSVVEARQFLGDLPPDQVIAAYAACGGYPLHLRRWLTTEPVTENLRELAFTPGGLLLRDAPDILSEDLDWRGGYERVLMAMSGGPRRRSRIASRAQQRIDYTLDRLRHAGYVAVTRSIGDLGAPDPLYEIADTYVAFWFALLRDDADLIEGGQGEPIRLRTAGRWQTHVGRVFEQLCREHAQRLVTAGVLPAQTVIGRWWRDEEAEIDVLGLVDQTPVLIGECRWQTAVPGERDLSDLRRKAAWLPAAEPRYAFWTRRVAPDLRGRPDVLLYGPAEVIGDH